MFTFALIVHVAAVVLWIGGVAMVTTIVIPAALRQKTAQEQLAFFSAVESRFVWHARGAVIFVGISGFYMGGRLGLWADFSPLRDWWLTAMIAVWVIFTLMLFLIEPVFLHDWFEERLKAEPERMFTRLQRMHWILLVLSLIAIAGGAAASHGLAP